MGKTAGRKPDVRADRAGDAKRPLPTGDVGALASPPPELSEPAREVWQGVVPFLSQSGALVEADRGLLVELVEALAMAAQYRAALQRGMAAGTVKEFDRGGVPFTVPFMGSPTEKRLRTGYVQMLQTAEGLASEFGMTPTARVRLGLAKLQGASLLGLLDDVNPVIDTREVAE